MTPASRGLVGFALAAPLVLLGPLPYSVHLVVSVLLLGVVPGLVLARTLRTGDPLLAALVTVTGSLAVTVATSTLLLYLHLWSGPAVTFLIGLSVAALELGRGRVPDGAA